MKKIIKQMRCKHRYLTVHEDTMYKDGKTYLHKVEICYICEKTKKTKELKTISLDLMKI
ncbi:MAG: hypothetical protein ACRCXT_08800 [Paraclostridium sp.]